MAIQFKKATKSQAKLRLALIGPSGSGKTYSALAIASGLGKRIALIDTEHESASLYAGNGGFEFDTCCLTSFSPENYIEAIRAAEQDYDVIIIDSLSHAWFGKGGALEMVDAAQRRQKTPNSYTAWRDVTPEHNKLVDAIIQCRAHVIATMRAKTEYVQEKDDRGKTTIRKVGLAPIQRDGLDFEFTLVGDMDLDHVLTITKSRCFGLADAVIKKPGRDVADKLLEWLNDGAPAPDPNAQFTALGIELERLLPDQETLSDVANLSAQYAAKFKGAPADAIAKVKSLFDARRKEITDAAEEAKAIAEAS